MSSTDLGPSSNRTPSQIVQYPLKIIVPWLTILVGREDLLLKVPNFIKPRRISGDSILIFPRQWIENFPRIMMGSLIACRIGRHLKLTYRVLIILIRGYERIASILLMISPIVLPFSRLKMFISCYDYLIGSE